MHFFRAWRWQSCWLALSACCSATGCGNEVAQTAVPGPGAALDCSRPGALALPENAEFGDGTETPSALVGQGYADGEGPGIYVSARDAFRVYLNGELVVASASPRSGLFTPLSVLPGDNALTVVIAAESGTPTAWVQLDELEQSYESDTTWTVSSSPEAGFMNANFDDSAWATATDYGPRGALPGCESPGAFPTLSDPHWIGPASGTGSVAVLRKVIHVRALGYGAGTTGGSGAAPSVVQTFQDLATAVGDPGTPAVVLLPEGTYDFRGEPRNQATCPSTCSSDPTKTQYSVLVGTQTCASALVTKSRTAQELTLGSNKTIVGLGRGAQLRGVTFAFGSSQNIIVRNVAVFDVNRDLVEAGDAFSLTEPNQVWLDHCTTQWISDGFTDVSEGSRNLTISWFHYAGFTTDECGDAHTRAGDVQDANITFHHCFFDHVGSHAPKIDGTTALGHVFNDLVSDDVGYGVGATCGAQVLMQGNLLEFVGTPTERDSCADGTSPGLIDAPAGSNVYGDGDGPHHGGDGSGAEPHDSVFKPPYAYTVDAAEDNAARVRARAGCGGPWALPLSLD
ncbi:MAG TPA: hypothetical protein VGM29_17290 [Polyangiaceae bacterium]